ncbi:MAG: hypothetical protein AB7O86_11705 [Porticoccaceae bacterium]
MVSDKMKKSTMTMIAFLLLGSSQVGFADEKQKLLKINIANSAFGATSIYFSSSAFGAESVYISDNSFGSIVVGITSSEQDADVVVEISPTSFGADAYYFSSSAFGAKSIYFSNSSFGSKSIHLAKNGLVDVTVYVKGEGVTIKQLIAILMDRGVI